MAVRQADVVLVGGGVMSATLGMMLRQLDPSLDIVMVERLDHVAHESTDGWNNAGTGHAGYCELNYTPKPKMAMLKLPARCRSTPSSRCHCSSGRTW